MDWQKRSKIKMAELSGDIDNIIEAYQPCETAYNNRVLSLTDNYSDNMRVRIATEDKVIIFEEIKGFYRKVTEYDK